MHGTHLKQKTIFTEITKSDHKLSKTFYFIKISCILAELCFSIFCGAFLLKMSFPAITSQQEHCIDQVTITLMTKLLPDQVTFIFPLREIVRR